MNAGKVLFKARKKAGLTQRELGRLSGVKQPAIARIESNQVSPRVDTLDRLLRACGTDLEPTPRLGVGVDRTMIRELLKLTPRERVELATQEARRLADIKQS